MASPVMTFNTVGNALASQSIAASATQTFAIDFSAVYEGQLQCQAHFGTIAGTSGMQIDVFAGNQASGTTYDTIAVFTMVMAAVTSTTNLLTIKLSTGKYDVKFTNLDATNGLTTVLATTATVSSVA